jgi:hypothetical protein
MHNALVVYSMLALYGLITVVIVAYVHAKFRTATKALKLLTTEWETAESRHANFVGVAQEQISKLAVPTPAPVAAPASVRHAAVGFDTRNQVVAMAKRGIGLNDIARSCGLHEGEVEILLGMARLLR